MILGICFTLIWNKIISKLPLRVSLGASLIIFSSLLFCVSWLILIEINNGQPITLMWYIFILLFFRILALENNAKILTIGPRLLRVGGNRKR